MAADTSNDGCPDYRPHESDLVISGYAAYDYKSADEEIYNEIDVFQSSRMVQPRLAAPNRLTQFSFVYPEPHHRQQPGLRHDRVGGGTARRTAYRVELRILDKRPQGAASR